MDELFSQRLTELIKNSNYILNDMEESVGKKAATISRYASGEIKGVKRSTIVKLANFFKVNPAWLAGLSDEKYLSDINSEQVPSIIEEKYGKHSTKLLNYYSQLNNLGKNKALENIKDLTEIQKYILNDKKTNIQENN